MSTIKVNKLEQRSGCTATVGGGAGKTVTVDATTVTIGRCGGSVSLASGASQSGFGTPSSSVLWCTTAKTSPFTAADKVGYFVNTSGGTVTVTLPSSPSAGDVIAIKDYANTFDTNNLTICRGGSKISGSTLNPVLDTEGDSIKLIFVDATQGWLNVQTDDTIKGAPLFICATGGTISCSGDFRTHIFNSTGTFKINSAPTPANNNVSYLVVGGGGGTGTSGGNSAGGGGAGGFREGKTPATPYTSSPLVAPAGLPVAAGSYTIAVGAGGAGGCASAAPEQPGTQGSVSTFSSITGAGGGRGAGPTSPGAGGPGGSGGGGAGGGYCRPGGTGNTPPVSPSQGNNGGSSPSPGSDTQGGGGGGAGVVGGNASPGTSGNGGNGVSTEISGSAVTRGGGGAGGANTPAGKSLGSAGSGGGGGANANASGDNGTANTGGGAGGPSSSGSANGAVGGSGVVIIRYKFQ